MLVALTEDQEFFRETTERFLVEQASPDTVRALREDPDRVRPDLLAARRRAGLDVAAGRRGARRRHHQRCRPGRPEPGGLRVRAPRRARTAAADQHRGGRPECPRRPRRRAGRPAGRRGRGRVVRAGTGLRGAAPGAPGSTVRRDGDGYVLSGSVAPVEAAVQASHFLVTAADGDGLTQLLVPAVVARAHGDGDGDRWT